MKFEYHYKKFYFAHDSLFCLSKDNILRKMMVWVMTHPLFDKLILFIILLNSVSLAMHDYMDKDNSSRWNQGLEFTGDVFSVLFLVEAIIRTLAMGFVFGK